MSNSGDLGERMHQWLARAFPICRSITGDGVRQTLDQIGETLPLTRHEVASGSQVLDWTVPPEWNVRDAYVADQQGQRVIDFQASNLHLVSYSVPVDTQMSLAELQTHLHSLPEQPDAIPYRTSYYNETWGFCLSQRQRDALTEQTYRVVIDSELKPGHLSYAELLIPGETEQEVLITTYVCHPSMANNELSGPTVATHLGEWLAEAPRRLSYRLVFAPETIGAITYISRNLARLRDRVICGFNLSCIGDEGGYSFVASRYGDTLADRIAGVVGRKFADAFTEYSFLQRGSDERQYCSPGVDLPLVTLCRSKFGEFPEYHTSLDDLQLVTPNGLLGGLRYVQDCIRILEANRTYQVTTTGEPQLGVRGLYHSLGGRHSGLSDVLNLLAYADGRHDLLDISERLQVSPLTLAEIAEMLTSHGLLRAIDGPSK